MAGEILALRLLTLHNVNFYMNLVRKAREKIIKAEFNKWKKEMVSAMNDNM